MPNRHFPLRDSATLPGLPFTALRDFLAAEADAHELTLETEPDGAVFCRAGDGRFGAFPTGDGAGIFIEADKPDWLFTLQDAFNDHLAEFDPQLAVTWSQTAKEGTLPPNMALARVNKVTRLSADFWRIRLVGNGLKRFCGDDNIHFRLLLPPSPQQAQWPIIDANGRTVWPSGNRALHRAVYTVRACNDASGWIDADIVIHAGGRASDWAPDAEGQEICIAGPGGGGLPAPGRVFIAGDATAYPAIARMLETGNITGDIYLWGQADYVMPDASGVTVTYLNDAEELFSIIRAPVFDHDRFWIAGEKDIATRLGKMIKTMDLPKGNSQVTAYWDRGGH